MTQATLDAIQGHRNTIEREQDRIVHSTSVIKNQQNAIGRLLAGCDHKHPDGSDATEDCFLYRGCAICGSNDAVL